MLVKAGPFSPFDPVFTSLARVLVLSFIALAPLPGQEPERIRDVIHTKHDGVALTMDVFKPAQPNGAGIIKIVSGGWKSNHQGINDGGWPKSGYTTFVVVHGSQPRFQVEEIVADLHRAVRFVRAHSSRVRRRSAKARRDGRQRGRAPQPDAGDTRWPW